MHPERPKSTCPRPPPCVTRTHAHFTSHCVNVVLCRLVDSLSKQGHPFDALRPMTGPSHCTFGRELRPCTLYKPSIPASITGDCYFLQLSHRRIRLSDCLISLCCHAVSSHCRVTRCRHTVPSHTVFCRRPVSLSSLHMHCCTSPPAHSTCTAVPHLQLTPHALPHHHASATRNIPLFQAPF